MTQPAESLRARLDREGPLPVAESLRIAADVAHALAAAHARGVRGHDVRPETIRLAGGTSAATLTGAAGDGASGDDDVYAVGAVLYEMLAGEPPRDPVVPLRAGRRPVAEEVELIVAQALADDPGARFGGPADLAEALASAAAEAGRPTFVTGERPAHRRRLSPRWAFFATAVLGLLGASLWLRYTAVAPATPAVPPAPLNSIAVLPLVNASPDTASEYFSDGITRELIQRLGGVPGLRVTGPASSFAFKRSQLDARQIGQRLGVGAVVEGSVRQTGGRLRVTTHLVNVAQGFDLWSETYEGEESTVFAVQDDIARSIVNALRFRAPGAAPPPPVRRTGLDAYRAYLAGQGLVTRPTVETVPAAIAEFEIALGHDSAYAPAWAALARAHAEEIVLGMRSTREAAILARAAADRALVLDSSLVPARTALALVHLFADWNWTESERELQLAIGLNPNLPEPHHWRSHLLTVLGRGDESLAASRRALELSPADPALSVHLGWHYLQAGQYDSAGHALDRALALDPQFPDAHYHLALLAEHQGDYAAAESHLAQLPLPAAVRSEVRAELGRVYALAGRTGEARSIREELREAAMAGYVPSYHLTLLALAMGETSRAIALLGEAAAEHDGDVVYLRTDPRLERLRPDRRFTRILRSLGLP